jgi:AcrR family transcriptional regulator
MRKRAEQVDQTRQRITEAAMRLHTTIGPARASLSAIADAAGVTRLTLYRHFATADELFAACTGHWFALDPLPDADAWRSIPALEDRVRTALRDLYGWFRAHGDELYPIYRDVAAVPASSQQQTRADNDRMVAVLLEASDGQEGPSSRLRAALGHAVTFWTWRSLAVDQGLSDADAVDLVMGLVTAAGQAAGPSKTEGPARPLS